MYVSTACLITFLLFCYIQPSFKSAILLFFSLFWKKVTQKGVTIIKIILLAQYLYISLIVNEAPKCVQAKKVFMAYLEMTLTGNKGG